jgi:hypothetical protein
MSPYIYTSRNGVHIIDLWQTAHLMEDADNYMRSEAEKGKKFPSLAPSVRLRVLWHKKLLVVVPTTLTNVG